MTLAIVYSTGLCPYCFLAKRLLDRRGISYEERRMKRSERDRLADLGGGLTYPQKRSEFSSALALTTLPSAATTSAARRLSQVAP
jgi:hypothetical protein